MLQEKDVMRAKLENRRLVSAHWGVYEAIADTPQADAHTLRGLPDDPDPSPIGLKMLDALRSSPARVQRPAVRVGWLEAHRRGELAGRGLDIGTQAHPHEVGQFRRGGVADDQRAAPCHKGLELAQLAGGRAIAVVEHGHLASAKRGGEFFVAGNINLQSTLAEPAHGMAREREREAAVALAAQRALAVDDHHGGG